MIYPGSVPEFRVLLKENGTQTLQVRYLNAPMGYTGKWQDVPMVKEHDTANPT